MTPDWKTDIRLSADSAAELFDALDIPTGKQPALAPEGSNQFPVRVPPAWIRQMPKGCSDNPLMNQVIPLKQEDDHTPHLSEDPLGEAAATLAPGLIQKYKGRALVILTTACAIHCRYCFRRHFGYQAHRLGSAERIQLAGRLARDAGIREVILSGGDPLMLEDRPLTDFIRALSVSPHMRILRIHSRMPVVTPARITPALLETLSVLTQHVVMVLHINHPDEVSQEAQAAFRALVEAGVELLNQSVLLRGVNDSVDTLVALSWKLKDWGIRPYYLHMTDDVQGTAHFQVPENEAHRLFATLIRELPGHMVPTLVREVPGALSKVPVVPDMTT